MEEWAYEVSGMAFPRAADLPPAGSAQALEKYSAMRLFVQRARQTVTSFAPTPADITAIAQICELVEGSPLAIELAAGVGEHPRLRGHRRGSAARHGRADDTAARHAGTSSQHAGGVRSNLGNG